jgi:hypothetical protein
MIRTYKFLLRPTVGQAHALAEMPRGSLLAPTPGVSQERRDAYRHPSKTSVTYGMRSAQRGGHPGVRPGASGSLVVPLAAGDGAPVGHGVCRVLSPGEARRAARIPAFCVG